MPIKQNPDSTDADVILKLYDLRREAVMRQSRDRLMREFNPKSLADVEAVGKADHPLNVAYRMVSSYWEMAAGFVKHGIVHPEVFGENCAEGLILFVKVQPFVAKLRESGSPLAFRNIEWVIEHSAEARKRFELYQARFRPQK